jgi:hypothetical protein
MLLGHGRRCRLWRKRPYHGTRDQYADDKKYGKRQNQLGERGGHQRGSLGCFIVPVASMTTMAIMVALVFVPAMSVVCVMLIVLGVDHTFVRFRRGGMHCTLHR